MVTDTHLLLIEGLKLAQKTFVAAKAALGWAVEEIDEFVIHQVGKAHTGAFVQTFGIDPRRSSPSSASTASAPRRCRSCSASCARWAA